MLDQLSDESFERAYERALNAWADHWCDKGIGVRCLTCETLKARYRKMKAEKARREQQQHGGEG